MSPQFTPYGRDTVKEMLSEHAKSGDLGDTGDGLCIVIDTTKPVTTFGNFVRKTGWAPTAIHHNTADNELLVQFTPMREVGNE